MTPEAMPEPEGPEDERFVYIVTAAGAEALRRGAAALDSQRQVPVSSRDQPHAPRQGLIVEGS